MGHSIKKRPMPCSFAITKVQSGRIAHPSHLSLRKSHIPLSPISKEKALITVLAYRVYATAYAILSIRPSTKVHHTPTPTPSSNHNQTIPKATCGCVCRSPSRSARLAAQPSHLHLHKASIHRHKPHPHL